MKSMLRLMAVLLSFCWLAGCATSPTSRSRVVVPASQEIVRGEARTRANSRTNLGIEYFAQGQYGLALQEAKIALNNDNTYSPAYNLLANVYKALGDQKSAEDAFQRAMQLSPGDPEIANNYGWFLCETKREQQSFQYFNEALQNTLYSTPVMALSNAAECSIRIHDYKASEAYLKRALNLAPNSARALMLMANVKYQQQQYPEARTYIAEFHRNSEPNAGSAFLAYRIARLTGNREDEARYLVLLRKKFPDTEEYRKLLQGALE